jgi:hypothetical protein
VKSKHLFASLCLALPAPLALATTIPYTVTNATTSRGTLTGTLAIDSSTGVVTSADLTFNDASLDSPVFSSVSSSAAYNGLGQDWISGGSSGWANYGGQAALFFDTANLPQGGTLSICTAASACGTQGIERSIVQVYSTAGTVDVDLSGGTLTRFTASSGSGPASGATPEPSSLILFGTGALAIVGMRRLPWFRPAIRA